MVSINYSAREVCCKIVYYGPGLSGKTTNLQYIHSKVPQDTRGKLISLATEADRTLYFDFLPINIGTINGFQAKFQLYTVPGQVYYNATRKLVLRGVDGVVFVADSQPDKMDENIESLANLEENLREYGYSPDDLPLVLQYNKRDLPGVMSVEDLNAQLNPQGRPVYEASATLGNGVFDTLKLIIKLVLEKAKSSSASKLSPAATSVAPTRPHDSSHATPSTGVPVPPQRVPVEPVRADQPEVPSAEANVAVQTAPAVTAESSMPAYRPYPGGERREADRTAPPVGFGKPQPSEKSAAAQGESPEVDSGSAPSDSPASMSSPQMAPSLRRRGGNKKRGFLKRLFGIR